MFLLRQLFFMSDPSVLEFKGVLSLFLMMYFADFIIAHAIC